MTDSPGGAVEAAYDIIRKVPGSGRAVLKHASTLPAQERGTFLLKAVRHFLSLRADAQLYEILPVDIQTFVESEGFLNGRGTVYPAVPEDLRELNSGNYDEAVLTGAIGTGKSTIAIVTTAYQLYVLSCLKDPRRLFGLDPASEIVFALQSLTRMLADSIDYKRLRVMVGRSPYFAHHFPFEKSVKAEMQFPRNIVVRPLSGDVNAAIGSNIFGGIIDEINFMKIVEESKKAVDGGVFD